MKTILEQIPISQTLQNEQNNKNKINENSDVKELQKSQIKKKFIFIF